jgi:hypothetical protein
MTAATTATPDTARRLAAACPGWTLTRDNAGWWLTPPDGDAALIETEAALLAWLARQERREERHDAAA